MSIQDSIKNAKAAGSASLSYKKYEPRQYKDKQYEYYSHENAWFVETYAKYSSDYVEAEIQGLNPEFPFEYTKVHIRFANVVRPSASIANNFDNFKYILVAEKIYPYLRKGAKIKTLGSTWLVLNPDNMSGETANAVVQRCDATWHYHDYYGNVCSEPMAVEDLRMKANDADSQRSTMITKGYFNAKMQYNEATKNLLFTNSRIILGRSAYRITGYSDFIQEFTEDDKSINMIEFSIRYEEPNDAIDDMENRVAGGKTFKWVIDISAKPALQVGQMTHIFATSERNDETVTSTEEYPISYLYSSSDENIVTVDEDGLVTAVAEGTATITVTLEQNPKYYNTFDISVAGMATEPHVAFTSTVPEKIQMFDMVSLVAQYFENGAPTGEPVTWTVSGADDFNYTTIISENAIGIKCWGGSVEPLSVTASYGEYSVSTDIYLEGI